MEIEILPIERWGGAVARVEAEAILLASILTNPPGVEGKAEWQNVRCEM